MANKGLGKTEARRAGIGCRIGAICIEIGQNEP